MEAEESSITSSPHQQSPFGERPAPVISRRTLPYVFEDICALHCSLELRAGGRAAIMYAETASECVAICTVQGRMVLDVQPRTHRGTLFTREVSLAAPPAPRFRLVNVLDALARARLHRSPCPAWSDWSWLHDAVWALARRGYVQSENLSAELCMG